MSFFRRIFNNTPEDITAQEENNQETDVNQDEAVASSTISEENSSSDDDLPPTVPPTEELPPIELKDMSDDIVEKLDQTLPIDTDDTTIPELGPDFAMATNDLPPTKVPKVTRPLPESEQILAPEGGHLMYGQASDQGIVRMNNQDAVFSFYFTSESAEEFPDFGVFVVADGMGGHQEGEKASAITARTVATELLEKVYTPLLQGVDMNDPDQPTIVEVLVDAVQKANVTVREQVSDGGTTLTAAVVRGEAAYIAHVGDSRAYWINDNQSLDKITRDHSVVARLIELGQISAEEAELHEQRNVLYRAVGQNEDVEVEIHRKRLIPNCGLLLCSDGLWNMVSDSDMLEIIKQTPNPQEACIKLVALANAHGGTDNITALLIRTPSK
ncbi:MAG: PP2C family serine/threonine-protein phosphatase [Chloroflexota bacterium]